MSNKCVLIIAGSACAAELASLVSQFLPFRPLVASSYDTYGTVVPPGVRPTLILVDTPFATLDDQTTLTHIRTDEQLKRAPLIALTDVTSEAKLLSLIEAGMCVGVVT